MGPEQQRRSRWSRWNTRKLPRRWRGGVKFRHGLAPGSEKVSDNDIVFRQYYANRQEKFWSNLAHKHHHRGAKTRRHAGIVALTTEFFVFQQSFYWTQLSFFKARGQWSRSCLPKKSFLKVSISLGGFGPSVAHGKHSVRRRCVQATKNKAETCSRLDAIGRRSPAAAEGTGYKNRRLGKPRGARFDSRLV